MKRHFLIWLIFLAACSVRAQNWQWQWGTQASTHTSSSYFTGLSVNGYNQVAGWIWYDTSLWLGNIHIHHPVSTGGFAFPLYNSEGGLIRVIDLWSKTGNVWNYPVISMDDEGNTYLSCTFVGEIYMNEDTIQPAPGVNVFTPQLFLVKFSPDGSPEWHKLMYGNGQSFLEGMTTGADGMVYIATTIYTTFGPPGWVNYFGQDSVNFQGYYTVFMRIDPQGKIVWRKPVTPHFYNFIKGLFRGINGSICLYGTSSGDMVIGFDTIRNTVPKHSVEPVYIAGFDTLGRMTKGYFLDTKIRVYDLNVDEQGAVYFSGWIPDTLFWNGSQTVIQGDTTWTIFGKFSPNGNPLWYNLAKTRTSPGIGELALYFNLGCAGDSLAFSASCSRYFKLLDSVYYVGEGAQVISGICAPDGNITGTVITNNNYSVKCNDMIMDHCNNMVIAGEFRGSSFFVSDTITSYSLAYSDGCISRLGRYSSPAIDLGPDQTVCESIKLTGPPGYSFYRWNDGLFNTRELTVSQTGKYWLSAAGNDLCWATDTINIVVDLRPVVDLGYDTVIFRKDHIVYSILPGYEHYLWSTGDTVRQLVVYGHNLNYGDNRIWVSVTDSACITSDTVNVRLVPGIGMEEDFSEIARIYPNPTTGIIHVITSEPVRLVTINNLLGKMLRRYSMVSQEINNVRIDLSDLQPGLYFLLITTSRHTQSNRVLITD